MPQTQTLDTPTAPPPQTAAAPAAEPVAQDPIALAQQIAQQDYGIPPTPPPPNPAHVFGQSVAYGVTQNPDAYAKQLNLEKATGVPPEIQNGSENEVEQAAQMAAIHDLNLPQTAPKTAAWASNPDNAAVAHDDLGNLQQIEQGAATMRTLTPWQKFDAAANQVVMNNPLSRAAVEAVGASVKMAGDVGSFFGWHGDGPTRQNWLQQEAQQDMPETYGIHPTMVDKGAQLVGPMIPAALASGGISAVAGAAGLSEMAARLLMAGGVGGMFSASQGGDTFTQMAASGKSDGAAERAALKAFGVTLLPNMAMGMTDFVPALERHPLLASLGVGGATGAAGQVGQNVALGNQPWYKGVGKGALQGAAVMGGMHLGFGAFHAALGKVADAAEASKLRTRAPEAFQSATNAMFEGDGSLRVPAEAFVNYFHGKGMDAAAEAHRVGVSNLPEAIAAGSDLEIPKANWTARLAPEDQKGLIPDVVDPASGMTQREHQAAQKEAQQWLDNGGPAKLQADLEQADAETQATPEWQSVYSKLKQRYLDAGENEAEADSVAMSQANAYAYFAKQSGMNPDELLEMHNPRIVAGEAPLAVPAEDAPKIVPATPEEIAENGGRIPPGKTGYMPLTEIHVDPQRFQYKMNTDEGTGASDKLEDVKKFDPEIAQTIQVWHDPEDGKTYVINGHHRYELASRSGEQGMNVMPIEADNARQARATGALINIADDKGTAFDAAKYFRDSGETMESLKAKGIALKAGIAHDGYAMSRLSPEIFDDAVQGIHGMTKSRAVALGEATDDHAIQQETLRHVREKEADGHPVSNEWVKEYARQIALAGGAKGVEDTGSLFGGMTTESLIDQRTDVTAYVRDRIKDDKSLYGRLTDKGKAAKLGEVKGQKINAAANALKAQQADDARLAFEIESRKPGEVNDAINDAAKRLKDGEPKKQVLSDAYKTISERLRAVDAGGSQPHGADSAAGAVLYQRARPSGDTTSEVGGTLYAPIRSSEEVAANKAALERQAMEERMRSPMGSVSKAAGEMERNSPLFSGTDASGNGTLFQSENEPRGWFQMRPDGSYEIGKTKIGDMSTLVHEPAHAYLEMYRMLSGKPGGSAGLRDDFSKISEWLGTTADEARANGFTREQHEKWARANEQYVRDGKAPTSGLRRAFHNFAVWLGNIYQRATDLNVEVSPEVRGVMDRLYAGEGAVDRAVEESGEPRFKSAEQAGWTDEEYRNYAEAHGMAVDKARQAVAAELNAAAEREKTADYREEKANVRDAVTEQLDARPEYTAIRSLRLGTMDDGSEISLNKDALVAQYGEERVKALNQQHRGLYRIQGGADAETVAERLGFHSGEEMLRALEAAPRRTAAIDAAVRDHLVNQYGDVRYDGTLNDKARFALENDERAGNIYREMRALKARLARVEGKAADTKAAMAAIEMPPLEAYQAQAHDIIQKKNLADVQPYRYLNASRKFSRDAFEAAGKGDARRAFEARNKELLNHFLFREAATESEWVDKFEARTQKAVTSKGIQQRMALGDAEDIRNGGVGDTRAQHNWLLARYKMGPGVPEPGRSLDAWAANMYGDMMEPAITHDILTGTGVKDYRSVPLSELHDLDDALTNIRQMARMQYKVYVDGKLQDFAERRAALVEAARKNLPSKPVTVLERDYTGKAAAEFLRGVDVDNTRMEFLMDKLDGGSRGPWHDNLWNQYQDAKGREHAMAEQVTNKILDSMEARSENGGLRMLDKVMVDGIPDTEPVTRKDLVSMALNMGNAGNLDRLRKSFQFHGWNPEAIPRIAGMLTHEEWGFVQDVWDSLKPIGERMVELEKKQTGLPPTMVKVDPFTVQLDDGTEQHMAGGYYPIQIDPTYSLKGYDEDAGKTARNMMEKGYLRATTSRGYTKERTGFGGPLLFDYERVLSSHLTKAIKDITHREFIQSSSKFLLDPEVRQTLRETLGSTYEKSMEPWLRATVNDRNGTLDRGASDPRPWLEKVRSNLIRAGLTFKVSTGLEQFSHLPTVALYRKGGSYGRALLDFWKSPVETTNWIREASPNVMRFRGEDLSRDYNTALRDIAGKKSPLSHVSRLGMAVYKYNDHIWSFPLWLAAYRGSLLKDPSLPEGEAHRLAVHDADASVRMAMGVGDAGDQAPIMRSQDMLTKWATTMFGFENLRYNIMRQDIGGRAARLYRAGDTIGAGKILTAGAIVAFAMPALQGSLVTGNGPKKDQNLGEWAIERSLLFAGSTIPWLRNILSQFEYGDPTMAEGFLKRGTEVVKGMTSDKPDKDWTGLGINALEFGGQYEGIPMTSQAAHTARYIHRAEQGKIENPSVFGAVVAGGHK